MNAGFYLTAQDPLGYVFADYLIASIRKHMPDTTVVQFSDTKSPAVWGVDRIERKAASGLSRARSAHYAAVSGDWLFIDTDCVIETDVRAVFNSAFDIAVTDRKWLHLPELPAEFTDKMPYCAGVVFSRCPAFWAAVHQRVAQMSAKEQWYGDQRALAEELATGRYRQYTLPGAVFQYPPREDSKYEESADYSSAICITHYKGKMRKALLLERIQRQYLEVA